MQNFIDVYKDPLFGIMVLIAIVAIVAIADYSKARYKRLKRQKSIDDLSKSFDNTNIFSDGVQDFLKHSSDPAATLMPIARLYSKIGDHEQAINIYVNLLEKVQNTTKKIEILESLGISYYNAGFMHRAKKIFLEVLKNYPNNAHILMYFMITCENMGLYDEAMNALECIDEIKSLDFDNNVVCNIENNRIYLECMQIISNQLTKDISHKLLKLYNENDNIHSLILRHFKTYNIQLFWDLIKDKKDIYNYIDILWQFDYHQIPLSAIKNNESLMQVYCAKGYFSDFYKELDIFALEIIRVLNKYSNTKCDLDFSYKCQSCNAILPFYSHRCPFCSFIGENILLIKHIQKTKPILQNDININNLPNI